MSVHPFVGGKSRLALGAATVRLVIAGVVYGLAALAYQRAERGGGRPPVLDVVLVTVLVAVVLWVVQDPVDRLLHRIVLGQRAGGREVMQGLLHRMSTTLPVDEVVPKVAEVASRATSRPSAEVRLWLDEGERWAQAWPVTSVADTGGVRHAVGVRYGGTDVGEIAVEVGDERLSPLGQRLLAELAAPAALALSTVRLTVQLRRRKAELERLTASLEASRARLLTARVVEQRRLRGEVSSRITTHISRAFTALEDAAPAPAQGRPTTRATTPDIDPDLVRQAGTEAGLALDELRAIARGIYPPRLAEQGYAASVDGWLLRAGLHARIELRGDAADLHGNGTLESCLYFCTVTVLAALDTGGAVDLGVYLDAGPHVTLRVTGSGHRPMDKDVQLVVSDRVAAFDGTSTPVTTEGGGEVGVIAHVPCSAGNDAADATPRRKT